MYILRKPLSKVSFLYTTMSNGIRSVHKLANGHGHDSYRCVSSKSTNVARGVYVSLLVQWITSSILVHRLTIAMIKYKVKWSRNANGCPILRLFEGSKFQLKNNWNENLILGPINNGFKTKTTWFQPVY